MFLEIIQAGSCTKIMTGDEAVKSEWKVEALCEPRVSESSGFEWLVVSVVKAIVSIHMYSNSYFLELH